MVAGAYILTWTGTAGGRIYPTGSPTGAYQPSPRTITATTGQGLTMEFNTGTLGQVMLQLGTVATAWEPLANADELTRCQRCFWNMFGPTASWAMAPGTFLTIPTGLPTTMRAIPTINYTLTQQTNVASSTVATLLYDRVDIRVTPTSNTVATAAAINTFTASADL